MMKLSYLICKLPKRPGVCGGTLRRKILCVSPVVVSREVGVGEVDEMYVDGTRGCTGAIAVQNDNSEHASDGVITKSYTLPFLSHKEFNKCITTVSSLLMYL